MDYDEYSNRRTEFLKIKDDSIDNFDKTIFTVSTGALVLSITFIDKIGRPYNLITSILILVSWACWSLVPVANILSFYLAQKNMDKKIEDLDKQFFRAYLRNNPGEIEECTFKEKKYIICCNRVGLYLFLIAVITFGTYSILVQLHSYSTSSKNTTPTQQEYIQLQKDYLKSQKEYIQFQKGVIKMIQQNNTNIANSVTEQRGKTESSRPVRINNGKYENPPPPPIKKK